MQMATLSPLSRSCTQTASDSTPGRASSVACAQPFSRTAASAANKIVDRLRRVGRRRLQRRSDAARSPHRRRGAPAGRGRSRSRRPAAGRRATSPRATACCLAACAGREYRCRRGSRCSPYGPCFGDPRQYLVGQHAQRRMGAMAARRLEDQVADAIARAAIGVGEQAGSDIALSRRDVELLGRAKQLRDFGHRQQAALRL